MLRKLASLSCSSSLLSPVVGSLLPVYRLSSSAVQLHITDECANAIKRKNKDGEHFLRIDLTRGCHGYMYQYYIRNDLNTDTDLIFEKGDAKVVVNKKILPHIEGSTVDFETEMEREGFAIKANPKASSSCGCSRSFTPDTFENLMNNK